MIRPSVSDDSLRPRGTLFVSHIGAVYPSGFLPIICGTFPGGNLVQIYQRAPLLRKLRQTHRLEGKCRVCEFRHTSGGSRARAYAAITGNPFAEDPGCVGVPAALAAPGNQISDMPN